MWLPVVRRRLDARGRIRSCRAGSGSELILTRHSNFPMRPSTIISNHKAKAYGQRSRQLRRVPQLYSSGTRHHNPPDQTPHPAQRLILSRSPCAVSRAWRRVMKSLFFCIFSAPFLFFHHFVVGCSVVSDGVSAFFTRLSTFQTLPVHP